VTRFLLLFACAAMLSAQTPETTASVKDRLAAIKGLEKGGSERIGDLRAYLSDVDPLVRTEALKSIIRLGTTRSLDAIVLASGDRDAEVQRLAVDAMVNFYLPGYLKQGTLARTGALLEKRLGRRSDDELIEGYIVVRPEVQFAVERVIRTAESKDSKVAAIRAAGILRTREALEVIYPALRSRDTELLLESLIALRKIGAQEAGPRTSFLLRDPDDRVQLAAMEAAGLLQNTDGIPELRRVVAEGRTKRLRRAAIEALSLISTPELRDNFLQHLESGDEEFRASATAGLGRLKNAQDAERIEKLFSNERAMPARLAQAFALVMLGKRELGRFTPLEYLFNTLNSRSWTGVAEAYLIESARDTTTRKAITGRAGTMTNDEKKGLARVLMASGSREELPLLDSISRDAEPSVAQEGLRAARTLKARLPER
jgi:HEAT repeat protein